MPRRLDKAESRKRWSELRELWNAFDPIGVMDFSDSAQDEYEGYCGPSMRLLENNASVQELEEYIRSALDNMGIRRDRKLIRDFAEKMNDWFQTNWPETRV